MKSHYQVLIIGGGAGGISTAATLLKKKKSLNIGIIEPSYQHMYQAAWTLVGAGTFNMEKTRRPMASVMPKNADWIHDSAVGFRPSENCVVTSNGKYTYDYLVVSPGLIMEPSLIEGLSEALGSREVCSNYVDPEYTWEVLKNFKGGNAIFTQPTTPIKCGGAPQKIAYLAADLFRKKGLSCNVAFCLPAGTIFSVKVIAESLMTVVARYGIHFRPFYAPIKVDFDRKIVTFKWVNPTNNLVLDKEKGLQEHLTRESNIEIPYDMLHIAPPQVAPKFVRDSELANSTGWLDVNHFTLQHNKFKNIFGVGDCAGLPTAKTAAAVRKQVPVVADNILTLMQQGALGSSSYNGYSSCPLVTGYGKMILAEFDYDLNFTPDPKLRTFMGISDSSKEHWRLWLLKKYIIPELYWNALLKGREF